MKSRLMSHGLLAAALFLAVPAMASTTWYVNGVNGSDKNNCKRLRLLAKQSVMPSRWLRRVIPLRSQPVSIKRLSPLTPVLS